MKPLLGACLFLAVGIAECDPNEASTFLGGTKKEQILDVAVEPKEGAVYVAGYTQSMDFFEKNKKKIPGGYDSLHADATYTGQNDGFVAILSSDLKTLVKWTFIGGREDDKAYALAIDNNGIVYVVGKTRSDPNRRDHSGGELGGKFLWGNNPNPNPNDPNDPKQVAPPLKAEGFDVEHSDAECAKDQPKIFDEEFDAFVVKLSPDLEDLLAWTYLGGNLLDEAFDIALSPDGETVYVVGHSKCNCWKDASGVKKPDEYCNGTYGGIKAGNLHVRNTEVRPVEYDVDAVLWVLDSNLKLKDYTFLGGKEKDQDNPDEWTGVDYGYGLVWTEATGTLPPGVFVAGITRSPDFPYSQPPPPPSPSTYLGGGSDVFVARFSEQANLEAWTLVGSPAWDHSDGAIDVDPSKGVWIAIDTGPEGGGCRGTHDVWIVQLDESLSTVHGADVHYPYGSADPAFELNVSDGYVLGTDGVDQAWDLEVSDGFVWVGGYTRPLLWCSQSGGTPCCPDPGVKKPCFGAMKGFPGDTCAEVFRENDRDQGVVPHKAGGQEGFLSVVPVDLTGSCSHYVGSRNMDHVLALATDGELGVYLGGWTGMSSLKSKAANLTDFPTTTDALQPTPGGDWEMNDGFVTWLPASSWFTCQ